MPAKILLIVTLSERGGAQQVVYQLARHFQPHYDLTVACAPGGDLIPRLRRQGIRVVEFPDLVRPFDPWHDTRALWQLARWMRTEGFDLVHAHSTKAGLLARWAARRAGVPIVLFTAHGWAFAEGRAAWMRWGLARLERWIARKTDRIICVSHYDRELALRYKVARPEQLVVIHNGVEPQALLRGAADPSLVGEPGPWIVSVCRLAPQKDPLTLLRAFRALPQGKLLLVGDGPLRPTVERFVQREGLGGRVVLVGEQEHVGAFLKRADVFALSSRWEGSPLTIIEAMLVGLPVVATRVGGVPELVEHGTTGLLVPAGDPEALARALAQVLADPRRRRTMAACGRKKAWQEFTLERMLDQVRQLYHTLLARRA